MNLRLTIGVVLMLLAAAASAQRIPQYVEDLGRAGLLSAPTDEPPEMKSLAGPRFLELVPDSQREVCRIVLEHQARETKGLYRLRVVDGRGRDIMRCSL